jgi:hypothetical protein
MNKKRFVIFSVLNLLGYLIMVVVNGLANALPLNGKGTGEISDQYPNLFVPSGVTFSIWAVIYLLLLIFVIYSFIALRSKFPHRYDFVAHTGLLFLVSCFLNAGWIFAWHYQKIFLSVGIMIMLLISLIFIYRRLEIGDPGQSKADRYLVHLPFSIYLGWISVATIANVTALLVHIHWGHWGIDEAYWAVIMMAVGTALALIMAIKNRDIYFGLVIIWAYIGIIAKQMQSEYPSAELTKLAYVFIGMIMAVIVSQLIRRKAY